MAERATPASEGREMTIMEHLLELRTRLIRATLALLVGTSISVVFAKRGLELLMVPLGAYNPQTLYPTESFVVYFKIALIGGVALAMPVIVYQLIAFLLPGMMPHERRYLYFMVPGVAVCFVGGVAFASLIMLPAAVQFMRGFLSDIINNQWTLDHYISFVTRILFWMGIVFQTPLLLFLLAKMDLITAQQLGRFRKYAILLTSVIAAIVTPTPDPVNMMIVMVPLYLLYEVGILLARLARVGRNAEPERAMRVTSSRSR